jgi:Rieske 2Fe-2S family protein
MSTKLRPALPDTAFTLPSRYYTDADVFARELDVFYRRKWVNVGRVDEMPARGCWIARTVAGDSILIVRRDEDDGLRAFYNVCRHRGTQLCADPSGEFAAGIRCPYHAWTYDLDGRLIGAPHMDGSPGFSREAFPLNRVDVDIWEGFVFVQLDTHRARSLTDQLARLPETFAAWRMRDLRRAHQIVYDVAANWKLIVQNYNECLHCPTLHPALNRLSHYLSGENEMVDGSYIGGRMDLSDGAQTMSMNGTCARAPLPGLSEEERRHVYYYSVFPNFMLAPHPDYVLTHTLWPLAPNHTRIVCDWLVHPDEAARPGFDISDATNFWDMTNRQDWHVCELAQQGISSRGYQPGPYSNREELLYAFDRYIVSELGL